MDTSIADLTNFRKFEIVDLSNIKDNADKYATDIRNLVYLLERDGTGAVEDATIPDQVKDCNIGDYLFGLIDTDNDIVVSQCCFVVEVNEDVLSITISTLSTLPEFRSKGITSMFLKQVLKLMINEHKNSKYVSILVECYKSNNAAMAFYEKLGLIEPYNPNVVLHKSFTKEDVLQM